MGNSYLKNIKNGQSISKFNPYYDFYIDNTPTIGYKNDFEGATGKIYGYFYYADGTPIKNKWFVLNEGNNIFISREHGTGNTGDIDIDSTGFYSAEIACRSYFINQKAIYTPDTINASDFEVMHFQPVKFDIHENDSININFVRVLSSIKPVKKDKILLCCYPNPATDYIYFITSATDYKKAQAEITIYNSLGVTITSFKITSEQYQWNCSDLQQGTYIYTLSSGNKIIATNKFQIVK